MSDDARRKPTRVAMSTYHEPQSFGNNDLTFWRLWFYVYQRNLRWAWIVG